MKPSRRRFVSLLAALPLLGLLVPAWAKPVRLELTPACADEDEDPTPAQTEGPFFKTKSPKRSRLTEPGAVGTPMLVTGQVLGTNGQPVANALLDWWHADDAGEYDNQGFRLRGHHFSNAQGRFRLETIAPGRYPGRTRHFHVKVQAPGKSVLTTQLYFPDEPGNDRDRIFNEKLLMKLTKNADQSLGGAFTFVVNA
ncbi:MAG: intradiol ring-cleavage dioxygenase [Sphingobacteriaceae bacterium]|nr:intradiol ring-cleavage dioxygenase [Cytophagaceae bacterium]